MALLALKVLSEKSGNICVAKGEDEVSLFCEREYQEGDKILFETSDKNSFVWLQFDDALGRSLVYVTGEVWYPVPFGKKRINLSPKAFSGRRHLITARVAKDFEITTYRNLALNVNDYHENETSFPHASANVETRGEAVFAARNAIDGVTLSSSHGEWPFASWGINQRRDAEMIVDFGRTVIVDRVILYLRADFPHDNWWQQVTLEFSDGSMLEADLMKTGAGQEIGFEKKEITWVKLCNLKKSDEPSPFPALTQIEVYGGETETNL